MASTNKFKLFLNTAKHLRVKQLVYQLYYRIYKVRAHSLSAPNQTIREWNQTWFAPWSSDSSCITPSGELVFLGEKENMLSPSVWDNPNRSKLWLYNAHYFDVLNTNQTAVHAEDLSVFFERWMSENPPCQGNGWEPYPLSLRIVNLIKWFSREPQRVTPSWLVSVGMQTEALLKQIEYHILGNHVFANAKALVFAGTYFQGARANLWLEKGLQLLNQQIDEQFLEDGAHFELTPMYHSLLLWDMCDLVNLARCSGLDTLLVHEKKWLEVIVNGFNWLQEMLHPDETLSFFNDTTLGIAPEYEYLKKYAEYLAISIPRNDKDEFALNWLKDSGYCTIRLPDDCKAILDIGPIGPDYQPGHAHADTLSFELSLYSQRFLVNSGISQYGQDTQRHYERSTKAHNTVTVDHYDSSEVWSGFRVARRAYPKDTVINQEHNEAVIACTHDGYLRLSGRNLHRREWHFSKQKLTLKDTISGNYGQAESRLYFHPDIELEQLNNGDVQCSGINGSKVIIHMSGASHVFVELSSWHPGFGVALQNNCLVAQFKQNQLLTIALSTAKCNSGYKMNMN